MNGIPREEYPRPQFERGEWVNLNGEWTFEFDFCNSWMMRDLQLSKGFSRKILVPFCPESKLSGIEYRDFITSMYYHRELEIPETWSGKRILLHFGGVDFECEGFLDGKSLGTHTGGSTPFAFDLTGRAIPGKSHDFVLRVFDDNRSYMQNNGKQSVSCKPKGICYTRTTGIWQTVWMEAVPWNGLKSCHIVPNPDAGEFSFSPEFFSYSGKSVFQARVKIDGKEAAAETVAAPGCSVTVKVPRIRLWSPEDPFLYEIEYSMTDANGNRFDAVKSYAGLRKIEIENGKILLNDRPIYLRFVLDQGFYPDGVWTAPSDEALRRDVELVKAAGFNGVRLHQKVFEERYYYWADKLGLLISSEAPSMLNNAFIGTPETSEVFWHGAFRFLQEWKEIVKIKRNHPSVILWTPLNETGVVSCYRNRYRAIVTAIYDAAKLLDPTRPVNDCSGWTHAKTDIWSSHTYEQNGKLLKKELCSSDSPVVKYRDNEVEYAGQPYLVDEYGGSRYIPAGCKPWASEGNGWGYNSEAISLEEQFCKVLKEQTDAILSVPSVTGYCYTQFTNVEQEENGVFNYDRTPKVPWEKLRRIFSRNPANW